MKNHPVYRPDDKHGDIAESRVGTPRVLPRKLDAEARGKRNTHVFRYEDNIDLEGCRIAYASGVASRSPMLPGRTVLNSPNQQQRQPQYNGSGKQAEPIGLFSKQTQVHDNRQWNVGVVHHRE